MPSYSLALGLDEAGVTIHNRLNQTLYLWSQLDQCDRCSEVFTVLISPSNQTEIALPSKYLTQLKFTQTDDASNGVICKTGYMDLDDHARYVLDVASQSANITCDPVLITTGNNNWLPIVLFLTSFALFLLGYNTSTIFKKAKRGFRNVFDDFRYPTLRNFRTNGDVEGSQIDSSKRLQSLDVFRGIVIVSMIFCNSGAGGYMYLGHAEWYGIYFADLIFPAFLFIMGTSIGLSLNKNVTLNDRYSYFTIKKIILKRTLLLFLLGLIVNSIDQTDLSRLRIPGILQRLALAYLLVSWIHLLTLDQQKDRRRPSNGFYQFMFADLHPYFGEWIAVFVMLVVYVYFTLFFEWDSRCPAGYQGPGGFHVHSRYENCTGGAARAIDVWLLGTNHLYQNCTAASLYRTTMNHDPEGLLGTLPAVLITFYGLQVSKILINFSTVTDRISRFGFWSAGTAFVGFTAFITDTFPISKNLFSFSFVHLTASVCFLAFLCIYFMIDYKKYYTSGWPLAEVGCNSIALYLGHQFFAKLLPFYFEVDSTLHFWLLLRSTSNACIWIAIAIWMANNKIYIVI